MSKESILIVTPELRGMVSVGGLAEVPIALAYALRKAGNEVRIAMPYYEYLNIEEKVSKGLSPIWQGNLHLGGLPPAKIFQTTVRFKEEDIPLYLVKGHPHFDQVKTVAGVYAPDPKPYFFFPAAILRFLDNCKDWVPDIIHCHDYHTGLLSVYLREMFKGNLAGKKVATVFTIHNMGFQGEGSTELLSYGGLPPSLANAAAGLSGMEFYGKINCLKGAICYSDVTSTVSRTYAREIQTSEHGKGLHGVLSEAARHGRLTGIVNGIDNDIWDPEKLAGDLAFSVQNMDGKQATKAELRKVCGLPASNDPIISLRSRWSYQKGMDLFLYALRTYEIYKVAQVAVVAWAPPGGREDPEYLGYWHEMVGWAQAHPERIAFNRGALSTELHYAGSDLFVMPSLYEPCGLGQMEAMRFGSVPIVRRTGGLADTVSETCGYVFDWSFREPLDVLQKREGASRMMSALNDAISAFHDKRSTWDEKVMQAMAQENDWSTRVGEYEKLYNLALQKNSKRAK